MRKRRSELSRNFRGSWQRWWSWCCFCPQTGELLLAHEAARAAFLHYKPMGTRQDRYQQTSSVNVCMVKRQPSVRDAQIRLHLPCKKKSATYFSGDIRVKSSTTVICGSSDDQKMSEKIFVRNPSAPSVFHFTHIWAAYIGRSKFNLLSMVAIGLKFGRVGSRYQVDTNNVPFRRSTHSAGRGRKRGGTCTNITNMIHLKKVGPIEHKLGSWGSRPPICFAHVKSGPLLRVRTTLAVSRKILVQLSQNLEYWVTDVGG